MNISLNQDDYNNKEDFLEVLKQAIRQKGKPLAIKAANSLNNCYEYNDLLPDYLYWRMLSMVNEYSYSSPLSYNINITEEGAKGSYYFLEGNIRKPNNTVVFKVTPPEGWFVTDVIINGNKVSEGSGNTYVFIMPYEEANVNIIYGESFMGIEWRFGLSETTSITEEALLAESPTTVLENTPFKIQFGNTGNPKYIWLASKYDTVEYQNNEITPDYFPITNTFTIDEIITVEGEYTVYISKWKTEVSSITFKK